MERNSRKTRTGVVVSDKMDKTIVVATKDSVRHSLYVKLLDALADMLGLHRKIFVVVKSYFHLSFPGFKE